MQRAVARAKGRGITLPPFDPDKYLHKKGKLVCTSPQFPSKPDTYFPKDLTKEQTKVATDPLAPFDPDVYLTQEDKEVSS